MPKKSFTFQKRSPDPAPPTTSPDISQFIAGHAAQMTRKTIALPQEAFLRVKIEAAKRGARVSGARSSTRILRRVQSNFVTVTHNHRTRRRGV